MVNASQETVSLKRSLPFQYVDVHVHLTHEKFAADLDQVVQRAQDAGFGALVVNGLEPLSNRRILAMAKKYGSIIKPALGIYPTDAINDLLPEDFPHRTGSFDVNAEIEFIREQAKAGSLAAIGECGLDGHWVGQETFAAQERVFLELVQIAYDCDLPVIIHTRKLEQRAIEILCHHGTKKVDFHCYGGRVKHAVKVAEERGWYFSIPANARRSESFKKMLETLPVERILTETDAPYLAPVVGERNEPFNVTETVALFAEIKQWSVDQAGTQIWQNYRRLFQGAL